MINFDDITDGVLSPIITKKINGYAVEIKSTLTANDYIEAVRTITESSLENGKLVAEHRDIVERYVMLKYFTNIDVDDMSVTAVWNASASLEKAFVTIEALPIWYNVCRAVDANIDARETATDNLIAKLSDLTELLSINAGETITDMKSILDRLDNIDNDEIATNVVKKISTEE